MRRLNRDEYEQNLRDVLQVPLLDIRDMLPEDREAYHFNKVSETLDISHAQLGAYLDAAETALRQAIASSPQPPAMSKYSAAGTRLFPGLGTAGGSKAMFFIRDNKRVALDTTGKNSVSAGADQDSTLEMGLFRSPAWPYAGYPKGFAAPVAGQYRVRFSARAVLQQEEFAVTGARRSVAMTFRSRRPTNPRLCRGREAGGRNAGHRALRSCL